MLKKLINKNKEQKGFTLIELLAVIVILGIIAAIAVPAVANVINGAKDDADKANADLVESAARIAQADGLELDNVDSGTDNGYFVTSLITGGYLEKMPVDPNDGADYADTSYVKYDGNTFIATLQ